MIPVFSADPELVWLFSGVAALLVMATSAGLILKVSLGGEAAQATMGNVTARIRAWWVVAAVFVAALAIGHAGLAALFGLASFLALREFITLAPTRRGDHRALCWAFFVIVPLQYWLVARGWYGLFSVLIPVYTFLFIPIQSVLAGDAEQFLERTADIQWGLMVCVYCVSYAPALLILEIPGYEGENAKLLFFLVLVVELSDVLQFVWGKTLGHRKIAPTISPNKTWGGFLGGVGSATLVGATLWWVTPFTPWQAAGMSLVTTLLGFAGGLTMSAIKRDRGVKDYGTLIEGHGGVLDRLDSLCFAAPVFFHLTRYFFT
ncbi:MAG: putative CDP-diglyceride synthetase/phosphatidate cytidylyltransferase [Candidatus Rokubacteria bacterium CSP1-6]|nr:MAG: putative CDP-diglyceride synthetase/phosphatidate cytidylyltransferase [Candidatus Rokubacteria bacterium CSP1-6]